MKRLFFATALVLSVFGCSDSYDLGDADVDAVAVNTKSPTWDNGIGTLMAQKCANCHVPAAQRSQFVPGNTPTTVDAIGSESFFADSAKASLVQRRVFDDTTNPMPPKFATPLTTDEKTALSTWLSGKVVSIATICGTTGTSALTFANISSVISRDCGSCHNGTSQVAFDTLAKAKTYRSMMLQYLNINTMPPSNPTYRNAGDGFSLFTWLCFGSDVQ